MEDIDFVSQHEEKCLEKIKQEIKTRTLNEWVKFAHNLRMKMLDFSPSVVFSATAGGVEPRIVMDD